MFIRHTCGKNLSGAVIAAFSLLITLSSRAGETELVSVDNDGLQILHYSSLSAVSEDGRFVQFVNDGLAGPQSPYTFPNLFLHDRQLGTTELISVEHDGDPGRAFVQRSDITPDGCYVVFDAWATGFNEFVPGNRESWEGNVYVRDRGCGNSDPPVPGTVPAQTVLVNELQTGIGESCLAKQAVITHDGAMVAFWSTCPHLHPDEPFSTGNYYLRNWATGSIEVINVDNDGNTLLTSACTGWRCMDMTPDGNYVVFTERFVSGPEREIFVRDRLTQTTEWIGTGTNPSISANGRWVVFQDGPIKVYDRDLALTTVVSIDIYDLPVSGSHPRISADGHFIVYVSSAGSIVEDDSNGLEDVFLSDHFHDGTKRVSVHSDGTQANIFGSWFPDLSGDGRHIVFESAATNLVDSDLNGEQDIFLHDQGAVEPLGMIDELIDIITDLNLNNGINNSLDAKLDSALDALSDMNDNNDQAACNSLDALISAINAQSGNHIAPADAADLIAEVEAIQSEIGCS